MKQFSEFSAKKQFQKDQKKNFEAHFGKKGFFLYATQYTKKLANTGKLCCDTVLHEYQFFLWEFNIGKMDEKWSVMIHQQQALKGDNEKFHKKAIKLSLREGFIYIQ